MSGPRQHRVADSNDRTRPAEDRSLGRRLYAVWARWRWVRMLASIGWLGSVLAIVVLDLSSMPGAADNCSVFDDCFGQSEAASEAALGLTFLATLSLVIDFIPVVGDVKGLIEMATGRDLLTNEELEPWERSLGLIGLIPGGDLARLAKLGKAGDVARGVDAVGDAGRLGRTNPVYVPPSRTTPSGGRSDVDLQPTAPRAATPDSPLPPLRPRGPEAPATPATPPRAPDTPTAPARTPEAPATPATPPRAPDTPTAPRTPETESAGGAGRGADGGGSGGGSGGRGDGASGGGTGRGDGDGASDGGAGRGDGEGGSGVPPRTPEMNAKIDEFAALDSPSKGYAKWKRGLAEEGFTSDEVSEIVYQGALARGENPFGNNWKKYFEEISGTRYPGPPDHAHHLVEKVGGGAAGETNRRILEEVGINPLLSRENFAWAPNVAGQHGAVPQAELLQRLLPARGDHDAVVKVLRDWVEVAQGR